MRVGIVCEGSTDYAVLTAIVAEVLRAYQPTFSMLQPDFDRLQRPSSAKKPATGWQAVRSFLRAGNVHFSPLDLVVVQVDASIRHLDAVARQLESNELDALCEHVKGWIGSEVPPYVLITLPREELETWLVALHTQRRSVEALDDPAEVLMDAGLLESRRERTKGRPRPDKSARRYEELARAFHTRLSEPRLLRRVPELACFCVKLRAARPGRR